MSGMGCMEINCLLGDDVLMIRWLRNSLIASICVHFIAKLASTFFASGLPPLWHHRFGCWLFGHQYVVSWFFSGLELIFTFNLYFVIFSFTWRYVSKLGISPEVSLIYFSKILYFSVIFIFYIFKFSINEIIFFFFFFRKFFWNFIKN